MGILDVSDTRGGQVIAPKEWINHPKYDSDTNDNDFAIIKLSNHVTFNNNVNPICLPSCLNFDNNQATATGWGTSVADGSGSSILQKVSYSYTRLAVHMDKPIYIFLTSKD